MRLRLTTLRLLALAALALAPAGCVPTEEEAAAAAAKARAAEKAAPKGDAAAKKPAPAAQVKPADPPSSTPELDAAGGAPPVEDNPLSRSNVFASPNPSSPKDQPQNIVAIDAMRRIQGQLDVIRAEIEKIKKQAAGVNARASQLSLMEATQEVAKLLPPVQDAIDKMLRASRVLLAELDTSGDDLRGAAQKFRYDASKYRLQSSRNAVNDMADALDLAADDVPRRRELVIAFAEQMEDDKLTLEESASVLGRVVTGLKILTAGDLPEVDSGVREATFEQLKVFLDTLESFLGAVKTRTLGDRARRAKPPVAAPKPEVKPEIEPKPAPKPGGEQISTILPPAEPEAPAGPRTNPAPARPTPAPSGWGNQPVARRVFADGSYLCPKCNRPHPIPAGGVVLDPNAGAGR